MERRNRKSQKWNYQLRRSLSRRRKFILKIFFFVSAFYKIHRKISPFDITVFFHQLSTLLTAGVPIVESCEVLEKSQIKSSLRLLIYTLKKDMLAGKELSQCLAAYPAYFDELTCHLVNIGERTGKLDTLLNVIADRQDKALLNKKKLQQALFYPCLITIAAFIVTCSMFIFVIPRFIELFRDTQTSLPWLTLCIFYITTQINQFIYLFPLFFVMTLFCYFYPPSASQFKRALSWTVKRFPLVHHCLQKMTLAHFARNLAITFAAGIPIHEALKLATCGSKAKEFNALLFTLRHHLNAGFTLHHAMEKTRLFPELMIQMVKIGEETGMLVAMLNKISDFFEAEVDHLIKQFNQLLEPLIMLVLGVLIGGLIIGMYLPIFKLGNVL